MNKQYRVRLNKMNRNAIRENGIVIYPEDFPKLEELILIFQQNGWKMGRVLELFYQHRKQQ